MQNRSTMKKAILDVRNLKVEFTDGNNVFTAVNGISFQLNRGEILGIVGESGSGKSVTSLALMRLIRNPGKISSGEILFYSQKNGNLIDLLTLSMEEMQLYRGDDIAMIFQEPITSLNPLYTIGFQLVEVILRHKHITAEQAKHQAIKGLQEVQLLPSDEALEDGYDSDGQLGPFMGLNTEYERFVSMDEVAPEAPAEETPPPVAEVESAPEPALDEETMEKMKVAELRVALQARGLSKNGLKSILFDQLKAGIVEGVPLVAN